eukprot:m.1116032 g.1116032  ORF g.1116032 m.1116032 type:complete len:588 (+) comp24373_c0_seq16:1627-3390(+)
MSFRARCLLANLVDEIDLNDEDLACQFVHDVLNYSSQYGANAYCSQRIIGSPSKFPSYGDFADCFVVRTYGTWWQRCPSAAQPIERGLFTHRDFIEVEFLQPVIPKKVEVYETYHPGSIVRILARPCGEHAGKWVALWNGEPQLGLPAQARIFCPPLKRVRFLTKVLRIELDSQYQQYYAEFDAVQLTGVPGRVSKKYIPELADAGVIRANEILFHGIRESINEEETVATATDEKHAHLLWLPNELLIGILEQLDLVTILRCSRVCRRFYHVCISMIHSKEEFDLQPYSHTVNDAFLNYLGPKLQSVKRLSLAWVSSTNLDIPPTDNEGLSTSVSGAANLFRLSGRNLTALRLACCNFVTNPLLRIIVDECPLLVDVDIQRCQHISDPGVVHLQNLSHLRRLNLYSTAVSERSVVSVCTQCIQLEHLDVGHCRSLKMSFIAPALADHCPRLRSLCLWFKRDTSTADIVRICGGCPRIEDFDLGWLSAVNMHTVMEHVATKHLKRLCLTGTRTVGAMEVQLLAEKCPHLEQLDVLGNSEVTTAAIACLLERCRQLQLLDISFCRAIPTPQIDAWKLMYPHVVFKNSTS